MPKGSIRYPCCFTFYLTAEMEQALKAAAAREDRSASAILRRALDEYLAPTTESVPRHAAPQPPAPLLPVEGDTPRPRRRRPVAE